jgi:hypothetical protein
VAPGTSSAVFLGIAIGCAAAGLVLFALAPLLHRMTHGAEESTVEPAAASAATA